MNLVSIIMPCYNDGKYLKESIDSTKKQTYKKIELLIINDGSNDEYTNNFLNSISDEKIQVYYTHRLGPAGARNLGIRKSSGKYILPLDSDDMIEDTYVEKAVNILENDETVGVVYCQAVLFGEKSGKWDLPIYSFDKMLLDNIVFVTAMFRKEDWFKVGGFDENLVNGMEDYDFWLSILEIGKEIVQINENLFYYRIKPESRTTGFLDDINDVKHTYTILFNKHKKLYYKHYDKYVSILRDALIEQLFINKELKNSIRVIERLSKYPIIKKIIRKYIYKRM